MTMKVSVAFAQIDAKDDAVTGYSPVAFALIGERGWNIRIDAYSKENQFSAARMKAEYLQRLAVLQAEIAEKYIPTFVEQSSYEYDPDNEEDYSTQARNAARSEFPGPYADYYD